MAKETDYTDRLKAYRTYLQAEKTKYEGISREESLQGSISADQKVNLLEELLKRFSKDFPELAE